MENVNISHTTDGERANLASVLSPLKWVRRIRERRELLSLLSQPDYILKDIGLQRDEITRQAMKGFWTD